MNDLDTTISVTSNSPYIDPLYAKNHMVRYKNSFTVLTINIQSINAKFDKLIEFLDDLSEQNFYFSAICIQESWLHSIDCDVAPFNIPNYQCIPLGATVSKHGGLLIYLHSSFQYKKLELYEKSKLWEALFIEISSENQTKKIILGNIYRAPRDRNEDLKSFLTEYCNILTKITDKRRDIVITGDFNIDLLKLQSREIFAEYLDNMFSCSLYPVVTLPTRFSKHNATLIDHIFCNYNRQHPPEGGIILKSLSDHYPAFVALNNPIKKSYNCPPKFVTIQKSSPEAMSRFTNAIECTNFSSFIDENLQSDPTPNLEALYSVLINAKNKYLPQKTVKFNRHKHKINPWMTSGILVSIKYRDVLYKRFHQLPPDSHDYVASETNLKTYNQILNRTLRQAKSTYYHSLLKNYKNDSKKTWQTLRNVMNLSKTKSAFPNFFIINNRKTTNKEVIANHFNEFFVEIGPSLASELDKANERNYQEYLTNLTESRFAFQNINMSQITKIMKELKPKSSTDCEGLSAKLLKNLPLKFAYPLSIIVNQSLNTGIFPKQLKISKVIPLYKKDDASLYNNYRPISLLPIISKILEKVVHEQLSSYLSEHKLLFNSQHGFRKNHSTETASLEFIDKIFKHLDNDETPISIFLDLTKAFDTLDHGILLNKLSFYGIKNVSLNWFRSYLSDRCQFVDYQNCQSGKLRIKTGVPQGSILGPLLFNIYINDIYTASNNFDFILYADDTTLTCTTQKLLPLVNRERNLSDVINNELNKIYQWLLINKLSLNISKSKFMVFHSPQKSISALGTLQLKINNISLSKTREFDFLGTVITETVSWKSHTNKVCNKLARAIGILKKLKNTLPQYSLILLYNSLFASIINFSALVWGLHMTERILKLQKKAVRIVSKAKFNAHTEPLFKKLQILNFKDIVKLRCLQFYFKYSKDILPQYFNDIFSFDSSNHSYNTRGKHSSRSQMPKKLFTSRCIRFFIPNLLKNTSTNILSKTHTHSIGGFSNYVKNFFISSYKSDCIVANCYICEQYQ